MSPSGVESRTDMVCSANMAADGGVFSPNMDLFSARVEGLRLGVSFKGSLPAGVGVVAPLSGVENMSTLLSGLTAGERSVPEREVGRSGEVERMPSR